MATLNDSEQMVRVDGPTAQEVMQMRERETMELSSPEVKPKWNHKFRRRWVAALRGGTYRQCFGAWTNGGVEVCAGQVGLIVARQMGIEKYGHGEAFRSDAYVMMPIGFMDTVIYKNDEAHWSFARIADWIEDAAQD